MPGKPRVESPAVIAKAEQFEVDLGQLRGTGPNAVITGDDVFTAAVAKQIGLKPSATAAEVMAGIDALEAAGKRRKARAAAEAAAARAQAAQTTAAASAGQRRPGAAYALNPLVAKVRAEASARNSPAPSGAAPTLFAAGDVCAFTASGIPPAALLDVPWQARHALAAAPTAAEAYEIVAQCSGKDGGVSAEMLYGSHPGNEDYAQRVEAWRVASFTDTALENAGGPIAAEERKRRDAALAAKPLPEEDASTIDDHVRAYQAR